MFCCFVAFCRKETGGFYLYIDYNIVKKKKKMKQTQKKKREGASVVGFARGVDKKLEYA